MNEEFIPKWLLRSSDVLVEYFIATTAIRILLVIIIETLATGNNHY
jgi:hypothetical protein